MIYFMSIVIGILLVFYAALRLLKALKEFSVVLKRFEALTGNTSYAYLENLRNEMDELNYSYYEILDALSERMDQIESDIKSFRRDGAQPIERNVQLEAPEVSVQKETNERELINRLFLQGFSDQDIAKIMSIGIGKVALLRRLGIKE